MPITDGWRYYHRPMRSSPRISTVVPLLAATLLAGCGTLDVPRADNHPATGQKKARAVHHWDVLAGDVAARVAEKIASWPAGEYPIHVTVADKSSFNAGFLKLLTVHLLNRGGPLHRPHGGGAGGGDPGGSALRLAYRPTFLSRSQGPSSGPAWGCGVTGGCTIRIALCSQAWRQPWGSGPVWRWTWPICTRKVLQRADPRGRKF